MPSLEDQDAVTNAVLLVERGERNPESIREAELRRAFWYLQQIVRDPRLQRPAA